MTYLRSTTSTYYLGRYFNVCPQKVRISLKFQYSSDPFYLNICHE